MPRANASKKVIIRKEIALGKPRDSKNIDKEINNKEYGMKSNKASLNVLKTVCFQLIIDTTSRKCCGACSIAENNGSTICEHIDPVTPATIAAVTTIRTRDWVLISARFVSIKIPSIEFQR